MTILFSVTTFTVRITAFYCLYHCLYFIVSEFVYYFKIFFFYVYECCFCVDVYTLMTWVWSLRSTMWKERTNSQKLFFDFQTCAMLSMVMWHWLVDPSAHTSQCWDCRCVLPCGLGLWSSSLLPPSFLLSFLSLVFLLPLSLSVCPSLSAALSLSLSKCLLV